MNADTVTAATANGEALFGQATQAIWIMLRVGAALTVAPLIGTRAVPVRIRLIVAVMLSLAFRPLLPPSPPLSMPDAWLVLTTAREIAIGVALGFVVRLAFEAGALAGDAVSQGMGLSFAQLADPLRGANAGVVGQWFYIAFALLFLAFDGHIALVRLLLESYRVLPTGTALADPAAFLSAFPLFLADVLRAGVQIALPVMVAMLVVNFTFGVLARAAPSLNPIALGLPAALAIGLILLVTLTNELLTPVRQLFENTFTHASALLR